MPGAVRNGLAQRVGKFIFPIRTDILTKSRSDRKLNNERLSLLRDPWLCWKGTRILAGTRVHPGYSQM